uniref:Peptidase S1 domain-containing protein n=1 Tax=Sinocyclocheilus grahami TaxID=75366 RepID=A0A672SUM7_SINGR
VLSEFVFLFFVKGGMESGIIGGKVAELHSRPCMASIQINKHHTCGGMLLREDYVLTAAHYHFEVVLGAHNITKKEKSTFTFICNSILCTLFALFKLLCYLQLKNKAKLSKFVKVMPLFKKNGKTPANVHCSIAGSVYFNSERMICSVSDGKHAFCMGDSGSPLICNTKPQGIASYTFNGNCTNKSYPQVYVKISYFLPWIKKKMKMNELK